ncbi:TetR/AcrR family transcriptional regulator [Aestuariivita sp.]|jgi:AcrR family transcriptional regulator|uniref:TetR/AcrR family transcriptional regulator n=1 Tax=Aestuariivita sp. TaxID=1872407 RepID=UPI002171E671|nr:TetR/AcrR family transcriptional regulator [Aestuariivita sp.]MCE8007519.1 TetR/AcrR family transcriptional regulator [Aestuariivita sp.]
MAETEETSIGDRRSRIIETAMQLFLEKGFSGTSMSAIAKACGITKATLYHHFTGKDDLFIACVTYGYGSALDALQEIADRTDLSDADKIRACLRVSYDTIVSCPVGRMSPLIAEVSRTFPNVARSFHDDYIVPQQDFLWRIIEQGQSSGTFKQVDPKHIFQMVFGPIVTLSLSREMFASFDDLEEHFPVDALREGHINAILNLLSAEGEASHSS